MAIQNFWIEVKIDGKKEILKGGPKSKDNGFSLSIFQRQDGRVIKVITITGLAFEDETLETNIAFQSFRHTITSQR